MKPANFAAVYCSLYPELAEIARNHGYALAIHGSMAKDFDLTCIPWAEEVGTPEEVIKEITTKYALTCLDEKPKVKNHGRLAWTIGISFGECRIDLSFMPSINNNKSTET